MNQQNYEATRNGTKTMTRRPVKPQPYEKIGWNWGEINSGTFKGFPILANWHFIDEFKDVLIRKASKYKIGEVVEIETEQSITCSDSNEPERMVLGTGTKIKILNIKVERLQDITIGDCYDEGIDPFDVIEMLDGTEFKEFVVFKETIWDKLPYKAPYDWDSNPYVFAYKYEVIAL